MVFTCGFIDDAKQEAIADILACAELKARGMDEGAGGVPGACPRSTAASLSGACPRSTAFVGNSELDSLAGVLRESAAGACAPREAAREAAREVPPARPRGAGRLEPSRPALDAHADDLRRLRQRLHLLRHTADEGRLRSRTVEAMWSPRPACWSARVRRRSCWRVRTPPPYGDDRGANGLARLLRAVARRSGAHWIRLAYVNPDNLDPRVARVMRDEANVCHYVDLPIQHASPESACRDGTARGRRGPRSAPSTT